jgi:hypothetical protein
VEDHFETFGQVYEEKFERRYGIKKLQKRRPQRQKGYKSLAESQQEG